MSVIFHPLRVREVLPDTAEAVVVAFDVPPDLREVFSFTQGQYLTLRAEIAGQDLRRSYSICAGVDDGDVKRYRDFDSFPGFNIDAIAAKSFVKAVGEGVIVNVSSIAGTRGAMHCGLYSASKAALDNLTRVMAMDRMSSSLIACLTVATAGLKRST